MSIYLVKFCYPDLVKGFCSRVKVRVSQFGRVVKAKDLKSFGVTRTGSNPVADVHFLSGLSALKS